jgi:hypothetical protein
VTKGRPVELQEILICSVMFGQEYVRIGAFCLNAVGTQHVSHALFVACPANDHVDRGLGLID